MEQEKSLDPQLWHACAGPIVQIPLVNSTVFYFAQGHAEHAHAPSDFHAPRVPPFILCRVVAVKFFAHAETDEVYTKITLLPLLGNGLDLGNDAALGLAPPAGDVYCTEKLASVVKTLEESDANGSCELSLPYDYTESIFPRLDYKVELPAQTVIAKDIHGNTWEFRHIFRRTSGHHLLTTGWSTFVKTKRLLAGDSVIFLRPESGDLWVIIRRDIRGNLESNRVVDVNSARRVRVEAVVEAVTHAACGQVFEVDYYPRASTPEFCVKATDVRSAMRIRWCSGMRFKMAFETEDSCSISWHEGIVSAVQVADPIRWPNSPWRLLAVDWDESDVCELLPNMERVSPWLVTNISDMTAPALEFSSFAPPLEFSSFASNAELVSPWKPLMSQLPYEGVSSVVLRKYQPTETLMVESEKSLSKQQMESHVTKLLSDEKLSRSIKGSCDSGSGSIITTETCKSTVTALNMGNPNDDWSSFFEFLGNRLPPLSLSECRAKDVIDFLRMKQASGDAEALVGRLSAACEVFGIKPQDNPFHSVAVTAYLKAAKEMSRETECILVFSCIDNLDVDATHFIEAILKELHKREVTPLIYNLSGKENLDVEMLYRSSVGIMIVSNCFARCSQSLDQLVAIMEHWKAKDHVFIPVYIKVTLSDFCGLEGRFEAADLLYLNSAQSDRVQKWKAALAEIASIDGHEWMKETQVMLVDEVVRNTCSRLCLKSSKNLVGILSLLNHSQPLDADMVGIWGMAGIGKTSIAREIFGNLAPQYDLCYFLQDFYLMRQMKGLGKMRDDFYSKVFGEEKLSIGASDLRPSFMRDWFHKKTILVVLDDVTNARDAEAVVGGFGWFSHGHRIIVTSRRKQVLVQCKVKEPYEIQKLSEFESFRLCKQYLKEESSVISELMSCCSGIPLALKVLGSSLSMQHINNMQEHLHRLRRNPPTQIYEAFRRSFDGLDENEKNIYLDIACFFRGENKDHVVQLLDACGFLTYLGISDLIDESLISVVDNKIEIPIPYQDIGRFIVHEEDEDPCGRSRLWYSNDIADVLKNNSGTEVIEGIFLDASDLTCELSPTVFGKMYSLRLLKLYCSTSGNQCKLSLPQGLDTLPDELRLLHWENYPLEYLPQKFNPENLVEVNMPYSNMKKLWEGKKNLKKLKKIKLSHSRNLTDILMLSEAMNLEHIDLEGCSSLVDVSTSIPRCRKLVSINMKDCSHLRSLPAMVGLTSLELLNLSGCSELEEIQDVAPNLKELYLAGTAIRELPVSVENLTELIMSDLENCRRLQKLPSGIHRSISDLDATRSTELELTSDDSDQESHIIKRSSRYLTSRPRWTVSVETSTIHDMFSWRKYGQKDILGSKFPREYYRCTNKSSQGCIATKQVQRSDEDPVLFEITYVEEHSCSQAANVSSTIPTQNLEPNQNQEHENLQIVKEGLDIGQQAQLHQLHQMSGHGSRSFYTKTSMPRGTIETSTIHDMFSWRKYGQKDILGSKFPREYYRCTNKFSQGCIATKQVQRSDEDPMLFKITYVGEHSCSQATNVSSTVPTRNLEPNQNQEHGNLQIVKEGLDIGQQAQLHQPHQMSGHDIEFFGPRSFSSDLSTEASSSRFTAGKRKR